MFRELAGRGVDGFDKKKFKSAKPASGYETTARSKAGGKNLGLFFFLQSVADTTLLADCLARVLFFFYEKTAAGFGRLLAPPLLTFVFGFSRCADGVETAPSWYKASKTNTSTLC